MSKKTLFLGCLPLPLIMLTILIWQQFSRFGEAAVAVHIYNTIMFILFTSSCYVGGVVTVWLLHKVGGDEDMRGNQDV